jgi:hypothetical protein
MESGISFQKLMHYNDAETRRWREFLEQDCDALDVQVDITGAKDICGLIVHVFAVELLASSACWALRACPMSNSPPADSMTFSVSPTPPPGNSGIYRVPVPQRRSRALKSPRIPRSIVRFTAPHHYAGPIRGT